MKKLVIFLLVIIFFPLISSANIQADYQIFSNKVLVDVSYDNVQNFTYKLPLDYQTLEIKTEEYIIKNNVININSNSESFSYITEYYVDKSPNKIYFILNNPFNEKADISIYLDEKDVLPESNNVLIPQPSQITSDGRRVILKFNDFENEEIVFNYEEITNTPLITELVILILILIILIIILRYLFLRKNQKKTQKTKNLYKDEKEIIEYLLSNKDNESWTKEMVKELKISKVKLSRKLRSLEQKGLIKKIPYGNENKIILVK